MAKNSRLRVVILPRLSAAWAFWARWLLNSGDLLKFEHFADQVAILLLTIHSETYQTMAIGSPMELPSAHEQWTNSSTKRPSVIHYHHSVDSAAHKHDG